MVVKALLVVNQRPIRRRILSRLKSVQDKLIKTKQELTNHLTQVRTAYYSWVASISREAYGSIEKLRAQIEERGMLLNRIEELYYEEGLSSRMAFQTAIQEKEEDQLAMDLDDPDDMEADFVFEEDSEKGEFNEDDFFAQMMNEFESIRNGRSRKGFSQQERGFERIQKLEKEQKIRSLYRQMALLLHPDRGMTSDKPAREIWCEVTVAYREKDLKKLEMLWISVQLMVDPHSTSVGISDLNQFIDFLAFQTHQINQEKRAYAKSDPSWNFHAKDKNQLSKIILSSLSEAEAAMKRTLKEIEAEIKRFEGISKKKTTQSD